TDARATDGRAHRPDRTGDRPADTSTSIVRQPTLLSTYAIWTALGQATFEHGIAPEGCLVRAPDQDRRKGPSEARVDSARRDKELGSGRRSNKAGGSCSRGVRPWPARHVPPCADRSHVLIPANGVEDWITACGMGPVKNPWQRPWPGSMRKPPNQESLNREF